MKKIVVLVLLICISNVVMAQDKIKQQLFYYSPKGLTFIPPLSKPGFLYDGKLYVGRQQIGALLQQLNEPKLNEYFKKYKSNKTAADILSTTGGVILPLVNVIVSANEGKFNWLLFGAGIVMAGTGGYLNTMAQKNMLTAAIYYDKKLKGEVNHFVPQQQSIGFTIPLGR